jgi:hypothetical protein
LETSARISQPRTCSSKGFAAIRSAYASRCERMPAFARRLISTDRA